MKNMNKIKLLMLGAVAAVGLTACDSVSEEDRFVEATIEPQRAVLLEEFTGQLCTNCPDGHAAVNKLVATLGDSIVPVGIHASGLSISVASGGLGTEAGETYYAQVGSPALPTGVIDRVTAPLQVADWDSQIDALIVQPTPFTVGAKAAVSGTDYNIEVAFSSADDYDGKLMVWVLENDIIALQLDHGDYVTDYVHNHVFRTYATADVDGEAVSLKAHSPQTKTYTVAIDEKWNASNLYVVAFLYNDAGVAQVTQTPSSH